MIIFQLKICVVLIILLHLLSILLVSFIFILFFIMSPSTGGLFPETVMQSF